MVTIKGRLDSPIINVTQLGLPTNTMNSKHLQTENIGLKRQVAYLRSEAAVLRRKLRGENTRYSYYDGSQMVTVDVLALAKSHSRQLGEQFWKEAEKDVGNQVEQFLLKRTRHQFNLKSFSEGGLTDDETRQLDQHFQRFLQGLELEYHASA